MSILKNKRTLSPLEYERRYMELYDYMTDRLSRLPRRYQAILGSPMREELGHIYDEVVSISDMYVEGSKAAERKKLCRAVVRDLEKFGAWVYLLWILSDGDNGIKPIEPRQRDYMTGLINQELHLLAGVGSIEGVTEMRSFRKTDVEKLDALKKLYELNGLVYPKIIRIPLAERDEEAALACRYIRDAFYCAWVANGERADNAKAAAKRRKYLGEAISDLYRADRPMVKMFMVGLFSAADMEKITFLINDSTKLLQGLLNSERERVSDQ